MNDDRRISLHEIDLTRYLKHVEIDTTADPIETTRSGLFGVPADHARTFIPGLPHTTITVTYSTGETLELGNTDAVHAYVSELLDTIRPHQA